MTESLLQIDNVGYSYVGSDWTLHDVSLGIRKGDFIGIVGANGSGKSTLLKIVAGILAPDTGEVIIENRVVKKIPRRKLARQIGYLPQQVNPVFDFNVKEIVLMGRFCHSRGLGLTTAEDRAIANRCMDATETSAFREKTINELSGGERQRVFLASVLAQQPEIMLLDEPVTGLDLHHQVAFFKLLAEFSMKGMTVLVVTHDLNLASQFCDKILLMDKGRKAVFASVEEVFQHLEEMPNYSRDISIFRHPANGKPAILPEYDSEKVSTMTANNRENAH